MTQQNIASLYLGRRTDFSKQLEKVRTDIGQISTGRLVVAAIFILFIYLSASLREFAFLYFLPVLVAVFAILVKQHSKAFAEKIRLQNLVKINDIELNALKGTYDGLVTGNEFIDMHHPYAHDLDLFGEGSLFQYANRSNTRDGRKNFANSLTSHLPDATSINRQQEAIRELTPRVEFRQGIQAGGMEMTETAKDRDQIREWLRQPSFVYKKGILKFLLTFVPALTVICIAGAFFFPLSKAAALVLVLSQWAFLGFYVKRINLFHDYISRKKDILKKYAELLHILASESFSSPQLQSLVNDAQEASKEVRKLASLVSALDARLNFMTTVVMNSVLLYDLQFVYRLEKWKEEHASRLDKWIDAISETEVLCSWGTFAFNNPDFAYAKIHKELTLSATSLGHPLIQQNERVNNDVFIGKDQRIQIITGANMAGKSTFLRSIGVNLALALAGAPTCSKEFNCSIIHLRTGMRTADSLKDHQSYFYAELNRLKSIMDELKQDKPLLVLLDEILKGTNSNDKLSGSIAMVKQFLPHPCLALIATHDLALGELEKTHHEAIKNFCFEANIENDQLFFDYKLKPGLAQRMNATFLMKKMGIIPG